MILRSGRERRDAGVVEEEEGGEQVAAVFQSDWSHGTGTTDEFLGDNGKWPTINSPAVDLHDVIAAPAGFPANMANVYRQFYTKNGSPGCTCNGTWDALAVGDTRHIRFYHLLDSDYAPGGDPPDTSKHNYLPSPNEALWAFQQEQGSGATYWFDFQCYDSSNGNQHHRYRITGLVKGQVYRMTASFTRVSTTAFTFSATIHDSNGDLVAGNADFSCQSHTAHDIDPDYEHVNAEADFDSLTGCRISMEGVAAADEDPVDDYFLTGGWVVVDNNDPGEYGDVEGEATS